MLREERSRMKEQGDPVTGKRNESTKKSILLLSLRVGADARE